MQRPNVYDYVKILAIGAMIIDHVWFLFYPELDILRIVGRISFPLFLFLVGYNHSYRWKSSLWFWWLLLQVLLWIGYIYWVSDIWYVNILLAIWWTRIVLRWVQMYTSYILEGILLIVCLLFSWYSYEYIDYGTMSIVFGLLGYWIRKYGASVYTILLMVLCISFHLIFMAIEHGFNNHAFSLSLVWVVLFVIMYTMSKSNYAILSSSHIWNNIIVYISTYALEIYILQALILGSIYLFV
jgi:hypothetical protein